MDPKSATQERSEALAHARAVDTRIAAAWTAYYEAIDKANEFDRAAREAKKAFQRGLRYNDNYAETVDGGYYIRRQADAEAKVAAIYAAAEPLRTAANTAEEAYGGWSRFFLVEHIHRSQHCSSFRPTTRIAWLPDVSGLTEAEAVAAHGAILCTICFPSAPIEWTSGSVLPDGICAGSGKYIDRSLPTRAGYFSGNWATCADCGKRVGVSSSALRIPKHKPEAPK